VVGLGLGLHRTARLGRRWAWCERTAPPYCRRNQYGYAYCRQGDAAWCKDVDAASAGYGKSNRAQSTANEHDLYAWSFNQYAIRQGFGSFLERCGKDEWHRSGSLRAWGCS